MRPDGCYEIFDNLLHTIIIGAGGRQYVVGIQVDVTGMRMDLQKNGDQLAAMFSSILSGVLHPDAEALVRRQEEHFHLVPMYLLLRFAGGTAEGTEDIEIGTMEELGRSSNQPAHSLAPQFTEEGPSGPTISPPFNQQTQVTSQKCSPLSSSPPKMGSLDFQPRGEEELKPYGQFPPGQFNALIGRDRGLPCPDDLESTADGSSNYANHSSITDGSHWGDGPDPEEVYPTPEDLDDRGTTPTMKTQLQALDLEDPACVIIVRGTSKLGPSAGETLKDYFSRYGPVKSIHIPFTFKKKKKRTECNGRMPSDAFPDSQRPTRAPGRVFVVMESPEHRERVIQDSYVHMVQDVKVSLDCFKDKSELVNDACEASKLSQAEETVQQEELKHWWSDYSVEVDQLI